MAVDDGDIGRTCLFSADTIRAFDFATVSVAMVGNVTLDSGKVPHGGSVFDFSTCCVFHAPHIFLAATRKCVDSMIRMNKLVTRLDCI